MTSESIWKKIKTFFMEAYSDDLYEDPSHFNYVVLDTETTGFDYITDRVLSVGALRLENEQIRVADALEIYINQERYDKQTTAIHGILKRDSGPRLDEKEAMLRVREYIGDDIIVAHHARFDMKMLNKAMRRQGLPPLQNTVLDTAHMYRKTLIRSPLLKKQDSYSLDELADKFNISKKDRHTALGDAYITAIAFLKILKLLRKKESRLTVIDLLK